MYQLFHLLEIYYPLRFSSTFRLGLGGLLRTQVNWIRSDKSWLLRLTDSDSGSMPCWCQGIHFPRAFLSTIRTTSFFSCHPTSATPNLMSAQIRKSVTVQHLHKVCMKLMLDIYSFTSAFSFSILVSLLGWEGLAISKKQIQNIPAIQQTAAEKATFETTHPCPRVLREFKVAVLYCACAVLHLWRHKDNFLFFYWSNWTSDV